MITPDTEEQAGEPEQPKKIVLISAIDAPAMRHLRSGLVRSCVKILAEVPKELQPKLLLNVSEGIHPVFDDSSYGMQARQRQDGSLDITGFNKVSPEPNAQQFALGIGLGSKLKSYANMTLEDLHRFIPVEQQPPGQTSVSENSFAPTESITELKRRKREAKKKSVPGQNYLKLR